MKNKQTEACESKIIRRWPRRFREGANISPKLIGAKIIDMGTPSGIDQIEGGGLVIAYLPAGETEQRTVVLAFNELGMWIHAQSSRGKHARLIATEPR